LRLYLWGAKYLNAIGYPFLSLSQLGESSESLSSALFLSPSHPTSVRARPHLATETILAIMEKDQHTFEHEDMSHKVDKPSSLEEAREPIDAEAENKLVRKIDMFLLPCMFFMYLLSYMDRTK
jgi:hypothetical protein